MTRKVLSGTLLAPNLKYNFNSVGAGPIQVIVFQSITSLKPDFDSIFCWFTQDI